MRRSRLKNIISKSKEISNKQLLVGEPPFEQFKNSLPEELESFKGDNYRLEAAWKAYGSPKNYEEAVWLGLVNPSIPGKMPSIGYNEDTDEYEYLNTGKENDTVAKDIRVWDNDVIPLVKELKLGGYVRTFNEEKNCWTYSKNPLKGIEPSEDNELQVIDYYKGGGKSSTPNRYSNGQKCNTNECALFSNGELRNSGYLISGNAWNLNDVDLLYSGYNTDNYPKVYNLQDVVNYNNEASNNFYKNFDSKTLNKDSAYVVNMYYKGSPSQEKAYKEGRDKMTGTHTGYVTWNPNTNRWEVTHNIHGTIHVDPFTSIQGGNKKYGITGIFTPREKTAFNQLRSILGLGEGGNIEFNYEDNELQVIEEFKKGSKVNLIIPSFLTLDENGNYVSKYYSDDDEAEDIKWYRSKDSKDFRKHFRLNDLDWEDGTPDGKFFTYIPKRKYKDLWFKKYGNSIIGGGSNSPMYYSDPNGDIADGKTLEKHVTPDGEVVYVDDEGNAYDTPYSFKQGGQMNVIPEGALHARKNNMELAKEGEITHKGIPVVDNQGELQAEIERNEIIFTKETTDKIEEYYKKFKDDSTSSSEKDELAIKCGKFLVDLILNNTDDKTGLIEEVKLNI